MARTERSRVDFNINIKGVKDAQILVKTLPKLIKQFDQLAAAMDKVEKAKGVSSTGRTKADAADRISRIELGVRKGDINNVQQLTANYASLVNQINALERAGAKTGAIQLRAYKMHQRLTDAINKRNAATRELIRTQMNSIGSTDKMRGSILDQVGTLNLSAKTLQKTGVAVEEQAMATKNASFLLLNAGYLIQDSPYGIRGMANNVSQLTQAYHMLAQRIEYINQVQGTNITVWQSLGSLLKGSTGIILLVGSVLPAALELLSTHWDTLTGSQEASNEALENSITILTDYIGAISTLTQTFGEDPLSIVEMKDEISQLSEFEEEISALSELEDRVRSLRVETELLREREGGLGGTGFLTNLFFGDKRSQVKEDLKESQENLERIRKDTGALADVPLEKLTEKLEDMRVELAISEELISRNPLLQLEQDVSRYTEALQKGLDLYTDELISEDQLSMARSEVQEYLDELESLFITSFQNKEFDKAAIYKKYIDELREALETDSAKEEEIDITLPDINVELPGNAAIMDQLELDLFREQNVGEDEFSMMGKIASLNAQAQIELEMVREEDYSSFQDYLLAKEKVFREYQQKVEAIQQRSVMAELEIQAMALKEDIATPDGYQSHLNAIREYYDKRREIVRESVDDEIEQKKQLAQIDIEQNNEEIEAQKQLQNKKQQLTKNYAEFAITAGQSIANATDASARTQFQINKVASASQAIINGYLAYTKTLAQGGFLAQPLAASALALSIAQAGKIMSQSYDSARATGGGGGINASYRGLSFTGGGNNQPFSGSSAVGAEPSTAQGGGSQESKTRKIEIVDGFGTMVARGQEEIDHAGGLDYMRG